MSAWASWRATGGVTVPRLPRGDFSIVVDALYGIGLTLWGAPVGRYAQAAAAQERPGEALRHGKAYREIFQTVKAALARDDTPSDHE